MGAWNTPCQQDGNGDSIAGGLWRVITSDILEHLAQRIG